MYWEKELFCTCVFKLLWQVQIAIVLLQISKQSHGPLKTTKHWIQAILSSWTLSPKNIWKTTMYKTFCDSLYKILLDYIFKWVFHFLVNSLELLCCSVSQIQRWSQTHQSHRKRQLDSHHWGQEVWESLGKLSNVLHITYRKQKWNNHIPLTSLCCSNITGAGGVLSVPFTERKLQVIRHHIAIPLQVKRTLANTGQHEITR